MTVLSDSNHNHIIRKVGTHKTQCVHRIRPRIFKPDFPIDDIRVSKPIYPDNKRVEDTDIFDSNIPTNAELDPNENDNLDQDLIDNEPAEEKVRRQPVQSQNGPQERTPETHTRTENPPVEIEFNHFRPLTVRFGTHEETFLPTPRDESRTRVPFRDEHQKQEQQPNQTGTEDEDRMSSRASRNKQSM